MNFQLTYSHIQLNFSDSSRENKSVSSICLYVYAILFVYAISFCFRLFSQYVIMHAGINRSTMA